MFPSPAASNSVIYLTYALFLSVSVYISWKVRAASTREYLSHNGTQKAIPLALNFIAAGLGSGVLFAYPAIATICGVQGLVVYVLSSVAPMLVFGFLGPVIRQRCPDGFVLTEWARQRYGAPTALYLSFFSLLTMFLYMVSELSALQQIIKALTGLDGMPAVIVQVVVTTIYTTIGGFRVSFLTDNIQSVLVILLVVISAATIASKTSIDRSLIDPSGLTKSTLMGWQLLYILPVAVITNSFFLASFWLRAFASRSDQDLRNGSLMACAVLTVILCFIGSTGLLAVWSGAYDPKDPDSEGSGSISFFLLLSKLPAWVVGIILVMVVTLSTSAFDSLQSAMNATASNDFFRNRLPLWAVRVGVVLLIIPVIVLALRSPDILTIYLICDLVSASLIPPLLVGLWGKCPAFYSGYEVIAGGLLGFLAIFFFGLVYYGGDAKAAGELLILKQGLYVQDWSVFGAFVAAPVGALGAAAATYVVRAGIVRARRGRVAISEGRPATPVQPCAGPPDTVESCAKGSSGQAGELERW